MKTMQKSISTEKENGRIYTPDYIVACILDLSGYAGDKILKQHVIDNSCGDGAFLSQIVCRYCDEAKKAGYTLAEIKNDLSIYVHGIEIERAEYERCLVHLSETARLYGIEDVVWDVLCGDALTVTQYDGKMAFVLGNPPYVRVHHLGDSFSAIKRFSFAQNGMTDLYIAFFEIGIRMLKDDGVLGYITPSSYFNSIAGARMRAFFAENNLLRAVVDLKHYQAFSATTYTAITVLQKNKSEESTAYYRYDAAMHAPYFVASLLPSDYLVGGSFYFGERKDLALLKHVLLNQKKSNISVKNGYATLCDPVFIHDFEFESAYIIPVIKASKGILQKIIFPYDQNATLLPEETLQADAPLYQYLSSNRERLMRRSSEKSGAQYWYAFGRSQALLDTYKDKLAVNLLLRDENDFKFTHAPAGTGVYGGLYIISPSVPWDEIISALRAKECAAFVQMLGKYKSGGYYTFSSKDLKKYLDYKFANKEDVSHDDES